MYKASFGGSDVTESVCSVGDLGSVPELGRSPGRGHGTHTSSLAWRIPMYRGIWQATVHGVAKSQTRLSDAVSQVVLVVKNRPAMQETLRDMGSIPGSGRSPGEGNCNPLQYSCLDNPIDRGA